MCTGYSYKNVIWFLLNHTLHLLIHFASLTINFARVSSRKKLDIIQHKKTFHNNNPITLLPSCDAQQKRLHCSAECSAAYFQANDDEDAKVINYSARGSWFWPRLSMLFQPTPRAFLGIVEFACLVQKSLQTRCSSQRPCNAQQPTPDVRIVSVKTGKFELSKDYFAKKDWGNVA